MQTIVPTKCALARLAIPLGRYRDSIERLTVLLPDAETDQEVAQLSGFLGDALVGDRDIEGGTEAYNAAIRTGLASIEVYARLADLYSQRLNRPEDARATLDEMVKRYADDPLAFIARGQWAVGETDHLTRSAVVSVGDRFSTLIELAQNDAAVAREKSKDSAAALKFAALAEQTADNYEQTLQSAILGMEKFPGESEFYLYASAAADRLAETSAAPDQKNDWRQKSEQFLRRGVTRLPRDASLRWTLVNQQLERGKFDDARESFERLRTLKYFPPLVNYLEAKLMVAAGDTREAAVNLEKVRSDVIEQPAVVRLVDLTLADVYGSTGDVDRQIAVLRRVTSNDPMWLPGRERLAIALLQTGRVDEAVQEYRIIADRPGIPISAPLNFARLLLLQNLGVEESRRDWTRVEAVLDAIEKQDTLVPDAAIIRAEMLVAQGEVERARQTLAGASHTPQLAASRILLEVAQGEPRRALQMADEARALSGDEPLLRYAEAMAQISLGPDDLDRQLERLADPAADWTPQQVAMLAQQMIPLLISSEAMDPAEKLAERATRINPGDARPRLQLLEIAYRKSDVDGMQANLDALGRISGQQPAGIMEWR